MKVYISSLMAIFLCACTKPTMLLPEAQHVVIVHEKPNDCKMIGEVDGYKKNSMENLNLKEVRNSARNDMKNNAYEMGADTIFLVAEDKQISTDSFGSGTVVGGIGIGGGSSSQTAKEIHIQGIAYKCNKSQ